MGRIDREVVRDRLERAVHEAEVIGSRELGDESSFCDPANENQRYELEHRLFVAIQAVLDTASHIAVASGYRPITSYRDAMEALVRLGVAGPEISEFVEGAPGLRNKLAHEYHEVECAQIFEAMQGIEDVQRFAAAVWEWVEGSGA
jgi:uncharacterized protein YutE (UPF0331/DUF86 family)